MAIDINTFFSNKISLLPFSNLTNHLLTVIGLSLFMTTVFIFVFYSIKNHSKKIYILIFKVLYLVSYNNFLRKFVFVSAAIYFSLLGKYILRDFTSEIIAVFAFIPGIFFYANKYQKQFFKSSFKVIFFSFILKCFFIPTNISYILTNFNLLNLIYFLALASVHSFLFLEILITTFKLLNILKFYNVSIKGLKRLKIKQNKNLIKVIVFNFF